MGIGTVGPTGSVKGAMSTGDSVLLQLPEDGKRAVGGGRDGRDLTCDLGALTAAGVGLTGVVVTAGAGEGVFVGVNAE